MLHAVKVLLILLVFPVFANDSEDVYSIYFDSNTDPGTEKLLAVDSKFYNRYALVPRSENDLRVAAGDELVVDETGVYIEKNKLLGISREEIRENAQYTINEGYLHGVIPNDSVMVALEGESYYFLLPKKTYLYDVSDSENSLYRGLGSNTFLIISNEDNGYSSAIYLTISAGKIGLMELDFEQDQFDFRKVNGKKIESQKIPLYILKPSKKEWEKIMSHFIVYDNYIIAKKED